MSARTFTAVLRRAGVGRPLPLYHAHIPCRTMWGFGAKPTPPPPAPETPTIDPAHSAQLLKATGMINNMLRDKPDALNAIIKFIQVMEESGVKVSSGQMPGPVQLMKLAGNSKFREAYGEVQAELKNSGIDVHSPEFVAEMMKLSKQLPRGE